MQNKFFDRPLCAGGGNLVLTFLMMLTGLCTINGQLIPTLNVDCEDFVIAIEAKIPSTTCNDCCVSLNCHRAVYQVRLRAINSSVGAYNNGDFILNYEQLSVTAQAIIEDAGATRLDEAATKSCLGIPVSGSTGGFSYTVDGSNNSATLFLFAGTLETGKTLPVIEFTDYFSPVLFSLVVDFFPGEEIGAAGIDFLYVDGNSTECADLSNSFSSGRYLSSTYPFPATTNGNFILSLGTPTCSEEAGTFPVQVTSSLSSPLSVEYLDFVITLLTEDELTELPLFEPASGMPTPQTTVTTLPSNAGYVIRLRYESVSLTGTNFSLGNLIASPIFLSAGYEMEATLEVGRFIVSGGGCDKPRIGDDVQTCSEAGVAVCSDITLKVQSATSLLGDCAELKVFISLDWDINTLGHEIDFSEIYLTLDFLSGTIISPTDLYLDGMICPNDNTCTNCLSYSTVSNGTRMELCINTATGVYLSPSSYLVMVFNAPQDCIQDVWIRTASFVIKGESRCRPVLDISGFPYCTPIISGDIAREDGFYVKNVLVNIAPYPLPGIIDVGCDLPAEPTSCGPYSKCVCTNYTDYSITPFKDDDRRGGVNTFDLVAISRHILGLDPFGSPYKIIAADVNMSNTVTTYDIVLLRDLILRKYDWAGQPDWPSSCARSWRFVAKSCDFPTPTNPFAYTFPERIIGTVPMVDSSFVAIKTGDVNLSYRFTDPIPPNDMCDNLVQKPAPVQNFSLQIPSSQVSSGAYYTLPIEAMGNTALVAWQMGLRFDSDVLELIGPSRGDLTDIRKGNFGLNEAEKGIVRALWMAQLDDEDDYIRPGQRLFYLTFKAKRRISDISKHIWMDDSVLENVGCEVDLTPYRFQLATVPEKQAERTEVPASVGEFDAVCRPNPSHAGFSFDFTLVQPAEINLILYDGFGRRVYFKEINLPAGEQTLVVQDANLWPAGVYQWDLKAGKSLRAKGHAVKQ